MGGTIHTQGCHGQRTIAMMLGGASGSPPPSALARLHANGLKAARQKPTQADEHDNASNQGLQSVPPQSANAHDDDCRR